MRNWKDKGPPQMQELNKATIIFLGSVNAFTVMYILFSGEISIMQVIGLASSLLVIYLMLSGRFYDIMRWWAERQIRKRDNKWR